MVSPIPNRPPGSRCMASLTTAGIRSTLRTAPLSMSPTGPISPGWAATTTGNPFCSMPAGNTSGLPLTTHNVLALWSYELADRRQWQPALSAFAPALAGTLIAIRPGDISRGVSGARICSISNRNTGSASPPMVCWAGSSSPTHNPFPTPLPVSSIRSRRVMAAVSGSA